MNTTLIRQIALGVVVVAVAAWLFLYQQPKNDQPQDTNQPANTKVYQSGSFGFKVFYPENWKAEECTDNASSLIALGDREQLIICSSDAPLNAYVLVGAVKKPYWEGDLQLQIDQSKVSFDDLQQTEITVDGVTATRLQGKLKDFGEEGFEQPVPAGTLLAQVILIKDDKLFRMYFQDLANTGNTQAFDKLVENFEFTN